MASCKQRPMTEAGLLRLPADLLSDILSRLPPKNLCRFSAASKSCHALISDRTFRDYDRHLRLKQEPHVLITVTVFGTDTDSTIRFYSFHATTLQVLKLPLATMIPPLYIGFYMGSCSELAVLESTSVSLANPCTGTMVRLWEHEMHSASCGCFLELHLVKIAYVSSSREYKLLRCLTHPDCLKHDEWEVLALRTGNNEVVVSEGGGGTSWRAVSNPPFLITNMAQLDGFLYSLPFFMAGFATKGIARFDLEREEWSVVPAPVNARFDIEHDCELEIFSEIGGNLCLRHTWGTEKLFHIWFAKDVEKGEWMKRYSIDLSSLDLQLGMGLKYSSRLLKIMGDGRLMLTTDEAAKILLYDPKSRTFEDLDIVKKLNLEEEEIEKLWKLESSFYVESSNETGNPRVSYLKSCRQ